jgi:hypothetical protein
MGVKINKINPIQRAGCTEVVFIKEAALVA